MEVKDGTSFEERCWRRSRRLRKGWGVEGCRVGTAKGLEERRDERCGGRRAGGHHGEVWESVRETISLLLEDDRDGLERKREKKRRILVTRSWG